MTFANAMPSGSLLVDQLTNSSWAFEPLPAPEELAPGDLLDPPPPEPVPEPLLLLKPEQQRPGPARWRRRRPGEEGAAGDGHVGRPLRACAAVAEPATRRVARSRSPHSVPSAPFYQPRAPTEQDRATGVSVTIRRSRRPRVVPLVGERVVAGPLPLRPGVAMPEAGAVGAGAVEGGEGQRRAVLLPVAVSRKDSSTLSPSMPTGAATANTPASSHRGAGRSGVSSAIARVWSMAAGPPPGARGGPPRGLVDPPRPVCTPTRMPTRSAHPPSSATRGGGQARWPRLDSNQRHAV